MQSGRLIHFPSRRVLSRVASLPAARKFLCTMRMNQVRDDFLLCKLHLLSQSSFFTWCSWTLRFSLILVCSWFRGWLRFRWFVGWIRSSSWKIFSILSVFLSCSSTGFPICWESYSYPGRNLVFAWVIRWVRNSGCRKYCERSHRCLNRYFILFLLLLYHYCSCVEVPYRLFCWDR